MSNVDGVVDQESAAMRTTALAFEPTTHTYRIDGHVVPSITQVIGASNLWDDAYWSPEAAERGRYVHKAIELDMQNRLRGDTNDPYLHGCVEAWRCFRNDNPGKIVASEIKLGDAVFRFAGRLDAIYYFDNIEWNGRLGIIEIKTGQSRPWHALQTAAQAHLVRVNNPDINGYPAPKSLARYALYLNGTGYKVSIHDDPDDWAVFQSALTLAHWRTSNGKHATG